MPLLSLLIIPFVTADASGSELELSLFKEIYTSEDNILVHVKASSQVTVTLQIIDPEDNVLREVQTHTDSDGVLYDDTFKPYLMGGEGVWSIKAIAQEHSETAYFVVKNTD